MGQERWKKEKAAGRPHEGIGWRWEVVLMR